MRSAESAPILRAYCTFASPGRLLAWWRYEKTMSENAQGLLVMNLLLVMGAHADQTDTQPACLVLTRGNTAARGDTLKWNDDEATPNVRTLNYVTISDSPVAAICGFGDTSSGVISKEPILNIRRLPSISILLRRDGCTRACLGLIPTRVTSF